MAAVAGQVRERLRHEGRAQAVLLGDRLDHELEEGVPVGGGERVVVFPVHLELAVRVLMVVLVGLPAERQHVVADFGDHVVAAHQRLLVVAGLLGPVVGGRRSPAPSGLDQEELASTPVLTRRPSAAARRHEPLQHDPGRLLDRARPSMVQSAATQATSGFQGRWITEAASGIANRSGCAGRHVEPGGEAREAGAVLAACRRSPARAPAWRAGSRTGPCRRSGSTSRRARRRRRKDRSSRSAP